MKIMTVGVYKPENKLWAKNVTIAISKQSLIVNHRFYSHQDGIGGGGRILLTQYRLDNVGDRSNYDTRDLHLPEPPGLGHHLLDYVDSCNRHRKFRVRVLPLDAALNLTSKRLTDK
jgi:hypothetical protein